MVPTGMTIAALFADASEVVSQFSTLILTVVGLSLGIWGVKFLIATVKKARS